MYIYVVSIALTLSVNKTDWCLFYASHTQTTNIDFFFFSHTATDFLMLIIYLDHSGKLSGDLVIKNEEGSLTVPSLWGFFFLQNAARQRSVNSARSAGESPGAEGDTLLPVPPGLSV